MFVSQGRKLLCPLLSFEKGLRLFNCCPIRYLCSKSFQSKTLKFSISCYCQTLSFSLRLMNLCSLGGFSQRHVCDVFRLKEANCDSFNADSHPRRISQFRWLSGKTSCFGFLILEGPKRPTLMPR